MRTMKATVERLDSRRAARRAHGAWLIGVVAGALVCALAGPGPFSGALAPFVIAATPALAVLAALALGDDGVQPPLAGILVVVWAAATLVATLSAGPHWPVFAAWFLAPVAASALLRPTAPLWEGAALSALCLTATFGLGWTPGWGAAAMVGHEGVIAASAMLAPIAFVTAALWGVRAEYADQARRDRRAQYEARTMFDAAGAVMLRVASNDLVRDAGGGCKTLMGLERQEIVGERAVHLVDPPAARAFADALAHVRRTQNVGHARVTVFGRPVRARLTPTSRADVFVELTRPAPQEVKVAALERRHAEAVADAESKVQFYARLSHELRTPLNAVLGFADIMRAKVFGPMPVKYDEYVGHIHESASHLLGLVDSVMDLSKIEAGAYPLEMALFDVRDVVDAAMRMTAVLAEKQGVALRADVPTAPLVVEADAQALRQILINLIGNAVKFTPAEGQVTVRAQRAGEDLVLEVADTGAGMSPEEVALLGQPYTQTRTGRESKAPGAGLGLAIVRALAAMHGGRFEAESVLGEGTSVRVRAPVIAAAPDMASIA